MKKFMKKRAGFTLVELLIVIIIIGILAGAMLLVAGSGTDKAEATKIVSNMRSLKAATLLYYADKAGSGTVAMPLLTAASNDLEPYMDRKLDASSNYNIVAGAASDDWYVQRTSIPEGVREKLTPTAQSVGLTSDAATPGTVYAGEATAYMKAR